MIRCGPRLYALLAALPVAAACAVALVGCGLGQALNVGNRVEEGTPAAERLDRELDRLRRRAPPGATVRLDRLTSFEWDRVYAFADSVSGVDVNAVVGAEVFYGEPYLEDDDMLLVFTSGDELALATTIFPVIGKSGGPLFSREDAVLKRSGPVGLDFAGRGRPGRGG